MLTQIDLIAGITRLFERHKVQPNHRQYNAVIAAATLIADELAKPHRPATPGMGLDAWLECDETGLSSRYLARVLAAAARPAAPVPLRRDGDWEECPHPHDPDDFSRCVGLLQAAPELREHLGRMAVGHGPVWEALAARWPELESLFLEEAPTGKCPKLARKLSRLIADHEG